jgi:AcrR family transcriptional regulator
MESVDRKLAEQRPANEGIGGRPESEVEGPPLQGRARDTRKALLDAAWRLFSEQGFTRTTVDDIVRACGVSRGTFYIYFKNKTDIFETLAEEVVSAMNSRAGGRAPKGSGRYERVRFSNDEYLRFYRDNRHFLRELVAQSVSNEELRKFEAKLRGSFVSRLSRAMQRERSFGAWRTIDPDLASLILSGMVYWFAFDWLARDSVNLDEHSWDEVVDGLTEIWYHALFPDDVPLDDRRPYESGQPA